MGRARRSARGCRYQPGSGSRCSDTIYDVHSDHLDTPKLLTDHTGEMVWRAAHEAFGSAAVDEDPDGDSTDITFNIRFPGQYYDTESGLHYNRFRYYDPATGGYISADPIGQATSINLYTYVDQNPLSYMDPSGLAKGGKQNVLPTVYEGITSQGDIDAVFSRLSQGVTDQKELNVLKAQKVTAQKALGIRNKAKRLKGKGKGLAGVAIVIGTLILDPSAASADQLKDAVVSSLVPLPASLAYAAADAAADWLMNSPMPPSSCGGPGTGGDELSGTFTGYHGWLNRAGK